MSYSYVTLLANEAYLPGTLALARGLRQVESVYPLTVILPAILGAEKGRVRTALTNTGCQIRTFEASLVKALPTTGKYADVTWRTSIDKLRVYGMTEFEKLVFLDSDMLVAANIDQLFEQPGLRFSNAKDGVLGAKGHTFPNSGMMVVEPKPGWEDEIFAAYPTAAKPGGIVGDQAILHAHFNKLFRDTKDWLLPATFNCTAYLLDAILQHSKYNMNWDRPDDKTVAVIHYTSPKKPWLLTRRERWWLLTKHALKRRWGAVQALRLYFRLLHE